MSASNSFPPKLAIHKDNTLGERINFTQDYIAQRKRSNKVQKLIESAFLEISFKDERDTDIPIHWGCSENRHSYKKTQKDKKKFKHRRDADFHPYKRKKYKFRKSKTFKNPEKRYKNMRKENL